MTGFAPMILVPAWQAVIIGAELFISWSAISLPATRVNGVTVLIVFQGVTGDGGQLS
jgi:hypothetical protein